MRSVIPHELHQLMLTLLHHLSRLLDPGLAHGRHSDGCWGQVVVTRSSLVGRTGQSEFQLAVVLHLLIAYFFSRVTYKLFHGHPFHVQQTIHAHGPLVLRTRCFRMAGWRDWGIPVVCDVSVRTE